MMNYFFILNGRKLKNYSIVILTALVTAWFLFIQNISFPALTTEDGPKAIYKGKNGIALTFNIAWGESKAEPIIDQLIENKATNVTFFLSGSWAEQHQHLVEKISKAGFEIGLLGYDYLDYEEIEDKKIRQDILKAEEAFRKLGIKHKNILRSPNGHFDKRLLTISEKLGYDVVHWSIDSKDWKNPGVNSIVENTKSAKNGDIILFHASDSAKQTAVALPHILKKIQQSNIKLVTISEIIIDGDAKTREVN